MTLNVCDRGFTPLFAVLIVWRRSDTLAVFPPQRQLAPAAVGVGRVGGRVWIHLWLAHEARALRADDRALSTRNAAVGLLDFGRLAESWLAKRWPRARLAAIPTGLLVVVSLVGTVDAVSSDFKSRGGWPGWEPDLRRIRRVAPRSSSARKANWPWVGSYAQGEAYPFPTALAGDVLANWLDDVDHRRRRDLRNVVSPLPTTSRSAQRERLGLELIPGRTHPLLDEEHARLARLAARWN